MKIFIASDHAGFKEKEYLIEMLTKDGHELMDMGAKTLEPTDDYPDYVMPCARAVAAEPGTCGIVIGGSGQGEGIAANRVKGARAAVFYGGNERTLSICREHNDANMLALGARFVDKEEALRAVRVWLAASFIGEERHKRRIAKLDL